MTEEDEALRRHLIESIERIRVEAMERCRPLMDKLVALEARYPRPVYVVVKGMDAPQGFMLPPGDPWPWRSPEGMQPGTYWGWWDRHRQIGICERRDGIWRVAGGLVRDPDLEIRIEQPCAPPPRVADARP